MLAAATGGTLSAADRASAAESCPDSGPCVLVTVDGPQGQLRTLTISRQDIVNDHDITGGAYAYRNVPGGPIAGELTIADGLSLWYLVTQYVKVDAATVAGVDVSGIGFGSAPDTVSFSGPDVLEQPSTFQQQFRPLINLEGGADDTLTLFRPLRDDQDANGHDSLTSSPSDGPLDVTVMLSATPVQVTAKASNIKPVSGTTITLSASTGSANVLNPTFAWNFDDHTPAGAGASVSHKFVGQAGDSFQVRVTLSGGNGETGTATVVVTLGKTPAGSGNHPGTGSNHHQNAPATGPNTGDGTQVGGRRVQTPSNSNGSGPTTKTSGGTAAPTTTTGGSEDLSLPLITGQLIGSTQPLSAAAFVQQELDSATAPGAHTPPAKGPTIPAWVGLAAGFVALFAFGILSEVRPTLRRRKR